MTGGVLPGPAEFEAALVAGLKAVTGGRDTPVPLGTLAIGASGGTPDPEILALAVAGGLAKGWAPAVEDIPGQTIRAGYRVRGEDGKAVAEPSFAWSLATKQEPLARREIFHHLWGIDAELWHQLGSENVVDLARLWYASPGRRLVRDLELLGELAERGNTADFEALDRASGVTLPVPTPGWHDLHGAIPGQSMAAWQPKQADVSIAFRRLEQGSPHSLRGAAIAWLLTRATDEPFYEIGGLHRDLPGRRGAICRESQARSWTSGPDREKHSLKREYVLGI